MTTAFEAMNFAREKHANQVRKFTGAAYSMHLAEVAGLVATRHKDDYVIATAWLHDVVEDQGVTLLELEKKFGQNVVVGVGLLTDDKSGTRKERKARTCERLRNAPGWVQSIKCCDIISNLSDIKQRDPVFAEVYMEEKRELLKVMTKADPMLWNAAWELANQKVAIN